MKRKIIYPLCVALLTMFLAVPCSSDGQDVPPPPPASHDANGNKAPRAETSAPIGGGTAILAGLALIYGGLKFIQVKRRIDAHRHDKLSVS